MAVDTTNSILLGVLKGDGEAREKLSSVIDAMKKKVESELEKSINDGSMAKELEKKIMQKRKSDFINNIMNDYVE